MRYNCHEARSNRIGTMKQTKLFSALAVLMVFAAACSQPLGPSSDPVASPATSEPNAAEGLPSGLSGTLPASADSFSVALLAARDGTEVGAVGMRTYDGNLLITYETSHGWTLNEIKAWVGSDLNDLPRAGNSDNLRLGAFPYRVGGINDTAYTLAIPLSDIPGNPESPEARSFKIAAYADVARSSGGGGARGRNDAWADGEPIAQQGQGLHATYTTYEPMFYFLGQSRHVFAVSGTPEEHFATGFENFDATATSSLTVDALESDWTDTYLAEASQLSALLSERIVARGSAGQSGPFYALVSHEQEAVSVFQVEFSLNRRVAATMTGELYSSFDTGGTNIHPSVAAVLFNGGAPVFAAQTSMDDGYGDPLPIDESLTLEPGDYTLLVYAEASGSWTGSPEDPGLEVGGGGFAEYMIDLAIVETLEPNPEECLAEILEFAKSADRRMVQGTDPDFLLALQAQTSTIQRVLAKLVERHASSIPDRLSECAAEAIAVIGKW